MAKENVEVTEGKVGFVIGTIRELKKVTWPTFRELAGKTTVVLSVVIFATLFVWLVDAGLSQLLAMIINR